MTARWAAIALLSALLLGGCTPADLARYKGKAEQVTVDAVVLSAVKTQEQRWESQDLRWDYMKQAAEQIAEKGHPLIAVQVLDCYYWTRQPLYLNRVIEWVATINGEVDGVKVARPYPIRRLDEQGQPGEWPKTKRPWECPMPDDAPPLTAGASAAPAAIGDPDPQ